MKLLKFILKLIKHLQSESRKPSLSEAASAVPATSVAVRRPIRLQNLITSEVTVDTLHQQSIKRQSCSEAICYGALMKQSKEFLISDHNGANKRRLFAEACDFFEQYFSNSEKNGRFTEAFSNRLDEVREEIERTGTYTHRIDELVYGSKMAWRNAARCIGRIQWNKLHLFDARHCTTAVELFEAICRHIQFATNGGNLRFVFTVFSQPKMLNCLHFQISNNNISSTVRGTRRLSSLELPTHLLRRL